MEKKDYASYQAKDFVMDDAFLQWVKQPDTENDAFWRNWIAAHPDKINVVEDARQIILHVRFNEDHLSGDSFRRIKMQLDSVYEAEHAKGGGKAAFIEKPLNIWWTAYKVAAAIALLIVAGVVLFFMLSRNAADVTYTTGYGETRTLTLPDGSEVMLNANSTLHLAPEWDMTNEREVWLDGEAFFTVRKMPESAKGKANTNVRFIVHTEQASVEVLGTQFNVNNRRGATTVVLAEGRVQLESKLTDTATPLIMEPGEYVRISDENQQVTKKRVDPGKYSSWTQRVLIFDDTPLGEIAILLADNYGLSIEFQNGHLAERTFTATIPAGNLETLLMALRESFNISIEKDNEKLIFKEKNTP